jgi:hypothetical protein
MSLSSGSTPLRNELDAWNAAGLVARFWWRDDDAVTVTPQLRRLLTVSNDFGVGAGVAVIPKQAKVELVDAIYSTRCCIWQHGWGHDFYDTGEFGDGRSLGAMISDALEGRNALDALCGESGWQRVFVPPNHALAMDFKNLIPALGYTALSAGVPLTPELPHVAELNAEVDIMDWPRGRLLGEDDIFMMLAAQLGSRRNGTDPHDKPIGILTHHLVFDDHAWASIRTIFAIIRDHPAARLEHANDLSGNAIAPEERNARPRRVPAPVIPAASGPGPDVAVVITSCGRQDLLERTLESFFRFNTAAIREVVVIEDGDGARNTLLSARFADRPIRWLATNTRIGQMPAIDLAYQAVEAEYIFHCEDDWEFFAPGFIEKSWAILSMNPRILQVWLRAIDDTNDTVVLQPVLESEAVQYRILQPGHHTEEWGTWHGFSLNPGLRRRGDYHRLGSFARLDSSGRLKSWEVERAASQFYFECGFLVAILADRGGAGYVRHLGWGRRVGEIGGTESPVVQP